MSYCADLTFGLSPQALAILHLLAQRETEFAELESGHYKVHIETTTWYNGLERGVALQVFKGWDPAGSCRIIVFGERKEDDGIFVEHWDQEEPPFNAPDITQRDSQFWDGEGKWPEEVEEIPRDVFSRNETYRAADRVYELMSEYYSKAVEDPPEGKIVRFPPQLRVV